MSIKSVAVKRSKLLCEYKPVKYGVPSEWRPSRHMHDFIIGNLRATNPGLSITEWASKVSARVALERYKLSGYPNGRVGIVTDIYVNGTLVDSIFEAIAEFDTKVNEINFEGKFFALEALAEVRHGMNWRDNYTVASYRLTDGSLAYAKFRSADGGCGGGIRISGLIHRRPGECQVVTGRIL